MSENTPTQLSPQALNAIERQTKYLLYTVKAAKVTPVTPAAIMHLVDELRLAIAAG